MNKLIIPSILIAVVLLAGVFAFSPVDKAQTIHSSVAGIISINESTADVGDGTVFTITCTSPFFIPQMYVDSSGVDAGDDISIKDLAVDGNVINVNVGNALDIDFEDFYADLFSEADTAGGLGAEVTLSFRFVDAEDDADDPITVIATIFTNGACNGEFT